MTFELVSFFSGAACVCSAQYTIIQYTSYCMCMCYFSVNVCFKYRKTKTFSLSLDFFSPDVVNDQGNEASQPE